MHHHHLHTLKLKLPGLLTSSLVESFLERLPQFEKGEFWTYAHQSDFVRMLVIMISDNQIWTIWNEYMLVVVVVVLLHQRRIHICLDFTSLFYCYIILAFYPFSNFQVLLHEGGIYLDTDIVLTKKLPTSKIQNAIAYEMYDGNPHPFYSRKFKVIILV